MSDTALKVTLLGTGIPNPDINAIRTATLIEAGSERVLIDCGRGTVIRMSQMGFPHPIATSGLPKMKLTQSICVFFHTFMNKKAWCTTRAD